MGKPKIDTEQVKRPGDWGRIRACRQRAPKECVTFLRRSALRKRGL